jgi:hypothetical protein
MSSHNREYKGIAYTIHTSEKHGKWSWSYTIAEGDYVEMRDRPLLTEKLAIGEADHDARFRIDARKNN